jgi:co-chaperonin GroES (HSP10)
MADITRKINSFPLKPTPGFAIVERLATQKTGNFVTSQEQQEEQTGVLVAVGGAVPHEYREGITVECPAKVGDKIVHRSQFGAPFKYKGKEYHHIRFNDIFSIIEE